MAADEATPEDHRTEAPESGDSRAGPGPEASSDIELRDTAEPIYVPPGGPPAVERPSSKIFACLGEEGVEALIGFLYEELRHSEIRGMFPSDNAGLARSVDRSAAFFIGLVGGPPRFHERFGPPMMRARHMRVRIDEAGRLEWLRCFGLALDRAEQELDFPTEHRPGFERFLDGFSGWMVNAR